MNNGGFIILDRKLLEWQYFRNASAVHLWITILLKANWKDGKLYEETIPRGSLATSISSLSRDTCLSPSTIKRWLTRFEEAGMIERKTTNRWTIIKVLNYSTFQGISEKQVTQPANQLVTQSVNQRVNHDRTKKQEKQRNNIPPISPKGGPQKKKSRSPVRIDTPDWYKRVQSEGIPEDAQASPELIAEFEKAKKSFRKGE